MQLKTLLTRLGGTAGAFKPFIHTLGPCVGVALLCSAPAAIAIMSGLENVVRYDWIIVVVATLVAHRALLSIVLALHSAWLQYRQVPHAFESTAGWLRPVLDVGVCAFVCLLVWFGSAQVRRWHCEDICKRAEPVLAALDAYRSEHKAYPQHLADLPEWPRLQREAGVAIGEGLYLPNGLDVGHLKDTSITVYLTPATPEPRYECCVPIERMITVGLARSAIYYRTSDKPRWREVGVIWDAQGCNLDVQR